MVRDPTDGALLAVWSIPLWFDFTLARDTLAAADVTIDIATLAARLSALQLRGLLRNSSPLWRVADKVRSHGQRSLSRENRLAVARATAQAYVIAADLYVSQLGETLHAAALTALETIGNHDATLEVYFAVAEGAKTLGLGATGVIDAILEAEPTYPSQTKRDLGESASPHRRRRVADDAELLIESAPTLLPTVESNDPFGAILSVATANPRSTAAVLLQFEPKMRATREIARRSGRAEIDRFGRDSSKLARGLWQVRPSRWIGELWDLARHSEDEVWLFETLFAEGPDTLLRTSWGCYVIVQNDLHPLDASRNPLSAWTLDAAWESWERGRLERTVANSPPEVEEQQRTVRRWMARGRQSAMLIEAGDG